MRRTKMIALGLAVLAWPPVALAYSGTEAEQQACTSDGFSLCSDFIPDEAPIVTCLQSKRSQLSPACEQVMFPAAKTRRRRRSG